MTVIVPLTTLTAVMYLYGCATPADSPAEPSNRTRATAANAAASTTASPTGLQHGGTDAVTTIIDARPAALVDGKAVQWNELRPVLSELAGAEALQEAILDRRLAEALAKAGITITPDDVASERKLLLESLSDDPNQAIRLLDELRDQQRLGNLRFEALMRRNAGLRALIKPQVQITEESIQNMHELMHGPKRQARIMVLQNLEAAQAAINLVNSGVSFADVAVEMSQDSSAPRGGLLEPISRVDPAYPESVRQTMWTLNPGEMSGPVMIDSRYAVIMLVKRVAGDGSKLDETRPAIERLVRVQQERLLMDQMARQLVSQVQVTVFDDALHDAWSRRRQRASQ